MKKKMIGLVASGVTLVAAASIVTAGPADAITKTCARGSGSCTTGITYSKATKDVNRIQVIAHQSACGSGQLCSTGKLEIDDPNTGRPICAVLSVPADNKDHSKVCTMKTYGTYRVLLTNQSRAVTLQAIAIY